MRGVKTFVILAMTAFYFPIMPWCKRSDQLMADVSYFLECVETSLKFPFPAVVKRLVNSAPLSV